MGGPGLRGLGGLGLVGAVALGGCDKEAAEGSDRSASAYAGRTELQAEYSLVDDTAGLLQDDPRILRIAETRWTARQGEEWAEAADLGDWTATLDDGLWLLPEGAEDPGVEGVQLLPARLSKGATGERVEVTAMGTVQTWYGTFEDAVTVEVSEGDWAGEQAFARDFGLVVWTFRGERRELSFYE